MKFYITTSIPYANAFPHLGFALEIIQADVLARYHRLLGEDVFFLTGADEHGTKIAKAAMQAGKTPKEFCDGISAKFKELKGALNLSYNDFIRTTDENRHFPSVKKVWLELKKNGDIYKKKYKGLYCSGCEAFITKKDLVGGKCPLHKKKPELVEEENYFFNLSKYSKQIEEAIKKGEVKIIPDSRKKEILSFIKNGLDDISFSRSVKHLRWGIPVPGDKSQVIYVWSDALVNYISALDYANNGDNFKKFWPADVQCLGKDIVRFHAVIWLGMLLSLNLPLPKTILVHGFISVNGQKMSKSLGNIIDPFSLAEKYGIQAVRYFVLREFPPTEDGDYTSEKFEERYNSDLASGLGNLTARVLTLAEKMGPKLFKTEQTHYELTGLDIKDKGLVGNKISNVWNNYKNALENFKFNESLISIWELISFCDKYVDSQKPWELLKQAQNQKGKSQKLEKILLDLLISLFNIAKMLQPFLPKTSKEIFNQLGVSPTGDMLRFRIKKGSSLFPRI